MAEEGDVYEDPEGCLECGSYDCGVPECCPIGLVHMKDCSLAKPGEKTNKMSRAEADALSQNDPILPLKD